jgi:dihydrofolate synthase/folylpolyglutamate synthase
LIPPDYALILNELEDGGNYERSARARDISKLDGIRYLLDQIGRPEQHLQIVHIAGTNGKGSTALILAHLLRGTGKKVGCYTSPHLIDIRERIQINETCVSHATFAQQAREVLAIARHERAPWTSFFDQLTAIALSIFHHEACDWVILETGLGGNADSTNVTPKALSVITRIGIDHQAILGENLLEIAAEKLGIVRAQIPLLLAPQSAELEPWFAEQTARRNVPLLPRTLPHDFSHPSQKWKAPLPDEAVPQPDSRKLALLAAEYVEPSSNSQEWSQRVHSAFSCALLGRQSRHRSLSFCIDGEEYVFVDVILDGGHNADALQALYQRLSLWQISCYRLMIGIAQDKLRSELLAPLQNIAHGAELVICTQFSSARAASPQTIKEYLPSEQTAVCCANVHEALKTAAQEAQRTLVIAGSFHLLGEALSLTNLTPTASDSSN